MKIFCLLFNNLKPEIFVAYMFSTTYNYNNKLIIENLIYNIRSIKNC